MSAKECELLERVKCLLSAIAVLQVNASGLLLSYSSLIPLKTHFNIHFPSSYNADKLLFLYIFVHVCL